MSDTGETMTPEQQHREDFVTGLAELAEFYRQHPDLPAPYRGDLLLCLSDQDIPDGDRAEVDRVAKILGTEASDTSPYGHPQHYTAERTFGAVTLTAYCISQAQRAEGDAQRSYRNNIQLDVEAAE